MMPILDNTDYLMGVIVGMWLMRGYQKVLPIKVTQLPPEEPTAPFTEWSKVVEPMVRRLTICAKFDLNYTIKPAGAEAMAKMLNEMSKHLDWAVENHMVQRKKPLTTCR